MRSQKSGAGIVFNFIGFRFDDSLYLFSLAVANGCVLAYALIF